MKSGKLNKEEYINSLLNKAGIEKRTKEIQDEFARIEGSLPGSGENAPLIFKAQVLVVKGEKQVVEIVNLSTELNITATKILEKNPYDKSTKDAAAGLIAQSWIDLQETNSSVKLTLDKAQVSLENLLPLVSGIEKEKVNTTIDTAKNLKSRQAEVEVVLTNGAREYLAVVKALQLDVDPALLRNVGAVAYGESVSREQGALSGDEADRATLEWADRSTEYLGLRVKIITNARIDREILCEAKNELKEMEKEAIKEEENKKEAAAKEGARKKGEKAHLLALKIDALLKRGEISVSGPEATKLRRLALEQLQDNKPA